MVIGVITRGGHYKFGMPDLKQFGFGPTLIDFTDINIIKQNEALFIKAMLGNQQDAIQNQ